MARRPLKVTGFARFFLLMIIVAPLAYLGAAYYNGQDGVANLKKLLRIEDAASASTSEAEAPSEEARPVNQSPSSNALVEENRRLKEELDYKNKRIDELYREIEALKQQLKDQKE